MTIANTETCQLTHSHLPKTRKTTCSYPLHILQIDRRTRLRRRMAIETHRQRFRQRTPALPVRKKAMMIFCSSFANCVERATISHSAPSVQRKGREEKLAHPHPHRAQSTLASDTRRNKIWYLWETHNKGAVLHPSPDTTAASSCPHRGRAGSAPGPTSQALYRQPGRGGCRRDGRWRRRRGGWPRRRSR